MTSLRAVYYCSVSVRPDPDLPRRCCAWLAVLACVLLAMPVQAEPLGDLYSVTVPYSGDNDAAFREAMRDVLIRVTGRSDAPELPNLAPLVAPLRDPQRVLVLSADANVQRLQPPLQQPAGERVRRLAPHDHLLPHLLHVRGSAQHRTAHHVVMAVQ